MSIKKMGNIIESDIKTLFGPQINIEYDSSGVDGRKNAEEEIYKLFGVDPRQLYVKRPRSMREFDSNTLTKVVDFVKQVDARIDNSAMMGQVGSRFFSILLSADQVARKQEEFIDCVASVINDLPDLESVRVLAPLSGAASLLLALTEKGISAEKMFPCYMSGARGAQSGHTVLEEELPQQVLNPRNTLVSLEDIIDSADTMLLLLLVRLRANGSKNFDHLESVRGDNQKLHAARTSFEDGRFTAVHQATASYLQEANMVFCPFVSKNQPLKKAILRHCQEILKDDSSNSWAHAQQSALADTLDYPQSVWVTGGMGRSELGLFDMGIKGEDLLGQMSEDAQSVISNTGVAEWTLRSCAHVRPLLEFKYAGGNDQLFTQAVANGLSHCLVSSVVNGHFL